MAWEFLRSLFAEKQQPPPRPFTEAEKQRVLSKRSPNKRNTYEQNAFLRKTWFFKEIETIPFTQEERESILYYLKGIENLREDYEIDGMYARARIVSETVLDRIRSAQPPPQQTSPPPTPKPAPAPPKPAPEGAILGEAIETHAPLVIPPKTRERHLYLIGKSGTGKTTLIKNLITQDMHAGAGVCFIDPHGDAATELLGTIPPHRITDVIYFDPASEYAPSFNPFALPYEPSKLTEDIVSSFKMFFGESWGVRMEHLLRHGVLTLITHGVPHTLKDLQSFYLKPDWKEQLVSRHPDETIRDFWQYDPDANTKGAASPILNKLSQLLMPHSPMERIFSQRENDLDFSRILNEQKILIVNLSKGMLGDAPAFLLGGLIVTGIQQAALARAALAERERKDFFLYVDEFQNYTIASFNSILAEARKYRLFLTLANQTLGQLPNDLERNIFGNVATLVSFGVSSEDARKLQHEMHRTRYTARRKGNDAPISLEDLIENTKKYLASRIVIEDLTEHHPMVRAGMSRYFVKSGGEEKAVLDKLNSQTFTMTTLKELTFPYGNRVFENYDFKETPFPDVDDFINLPPHHAFARIERAENVHPFKTNPPPQPAAGTRGQILHAMQAQHEEREQKRTAAARENIRAEEAPRVTPQEPPPAPQKRPSAFEALRLRLEEEIRKEKAATQQLQPARVDEPRPAPASRPQLRPAPKQQAAPEVKPPAPAPTNEKDFGQAAPSKRAKKSVPKPKSDLKF